MNGTGFHGQLVPACYHPKKTVEKNQQIEGQESQHSKTLHQHKIEFWCRTPNLHIIVSNEGQCFGRRGREERWDGRRWMSSKNGLSLLPLLSFAQSMHCKTILNVRQCGAQPTQSKLFWTNSVWERFDFVFPDLLFGVPDIQMTKEVRLDTSSLFPKRVSL